MLSALEGAFVLARAQRSTEPLAVAGELMAAAVRQAVGDQGGKAWGGADAASGGADAASGGADAASGGERRKPRLRARWPSAPA
jgi:hypothetical protein